MIDETNDSSPVTPDVPAPQPTAPASTVSNPEKTEVGPEVEEISDGFDHESSSAIPTTDIPAVDPVSLDYGPLETLNMTMDPLQTDPKRPLDMRYGKISLPRMNSKEMRNVSLTLTRDRMPPVSEGNREWYQAIAGMNQRHLAAEAFESSLKREGSQWQQGLEVGAETIRADKPKFTDNGTTRLMGEEARLRIRSALFGGSRVRIPLNYSGLWVTIKAPTERELVELDERISQRKVEAGWSTNGLVFSSTAVFINDLLIEFILEHISETSCQVDDIQELRSIILQPDFMQLVWGMLCAIYPDGYVYEQPCLLEPLKCTHVEMGRLSFGKLYFVDNRAFTDWQLQHMRKRNTASMPKIDIERYQSEHRHNRFGTVKLNDQLTIEFKVPTLDEYAESGSRWIEGIISSVDDAFSKDLSEDERNSIINNQTNMTLIRQYAHWIRLLALSSEERYIEDRETLEDVVGDLTSDEDVFRSFFDGIKQYIDSVMVVVHGIPKYPCPKCQGQPSEEMLKHPMIFPIDLAEMFFTLVGQRIRRMLTRQR